MTLQELTHHFRLRERLDRDKELLSSLEAAVAPGGQVLTGMPHASGVRDKVGDLAVEIADMKERIRFLESEIAKEEQQVEDFIRNIPDEQLRVVFRLRFLHGLTWGEVAGVVGGRNTEEGVKTSCYRYLSS